MQKKQFSFFQMALYSLSALNLLVTVVCLWMAVQADQSVQSSGFMLQAVIGPLANVLLGYAAQAIRSIGVLFAVVNAAVSMLLFVAARLVKNHSHLTQRVGQLETRMDAFYTHEPQMSQV